MKSKTILIALIVGATITKLIALDWPLAENPILKTHFGSIDAGLISQGVVLSSPTSNSVNAMANGELIYSREGDDESIPLPAVLGSFMLITHDQNFTAVYAGLENSTSSNYLQSIKKNDSLGRTGSSAYGIDSGLYLMIFDQNEKHYINPLILLPKITDTSPPSVRSLSLLDSSGHLLPVSTALSISQGNYDLILDVQDLVNETQFSPSGFAAPFFIRLSIDGQKVQEYSFDISQAPKGTLNFSSLGTLPLRQSLISSIIPDASVGGIIYTRYKFTHGQSNIEILARDFAGNTRKVLYTIKVQ